MTRWTATRPVYVVTYQGGRMETPAVLHFSTAEHKDRAVAFLPRIAATVLSVTIERKPIALRCIDERAKDQTRP